YTDNHTAVKQTPSPKTAAGLIGRIGGGGKHLDFVSDPRQEHRIHKLRSSGATKRLYRRSVPVRWRS
ncbi:MAG: hypothetical protein Q9205_006130, partial [Flavoplaca limonia]